MPAVTSGAWILLAALALAGAFGGYRLLTDGRFRTGAPSPVGTEAQDEAQVQQEAVSVLAGTPYAGSLGERATLLQLSSAFCAPCRATRRVLEQVTAQIEGVAHVEVDAEQHLDLVRRLKVLRTPTTLVLDADGTEVGRAGGVPTKQQVGAALAQAGLN